MRILIYHGKHGDEYWLADAPEQMDAAFRKLFARLDEWGCYEDHAEGMAQARAGDIRAIKSILHRRQDYEYEGWDIEEALDPCTD